MERRLSLLLVVLAGVGILCFCAGIFWGSSAHAAPSGSVAPGASTAEEKKERKVRVVYPKKTDLDFEGADIQGEMRNPGEFYFQRRPEEKFDSLVKRRKNFHREMLRDAVLSK